MPMRIYPALHYTMGGLWVDYHLMSTIPGLFVAGEANFSDQGANRLGASALMQGLSDGYFILPSTVPNYLARDEAGQGRYLAPGVPGGRGGGPPAHAGASPGRGPANGRLASTGSWAGSCGTTAAWPGRRRACVRRSPRSPSCGRSSTTTSACSGTEEELNQSLEKAGRVADFLELAELMCIDALHRTESCGGHFRVESQTPEGEARRDDANFCYVAAGSGAARTRPRLCTRSR